MKQIYKYAAKIEERFTLELPEGAEILTAQEQGENPCIWALVDTESPKVKRTFAVYGTGTTGIPDDPGDYIGTFQLCRGTFVFHLFEIRRVSK
jgi:hypothetical protein